ncbi:hypothetical protein ACPF04_07275 [Campylobacter sp. MOP51]
MGKFYGEYCSDDEIFDYRLFFMTICKNGKSKYICENYMIGIVI